MTPDIGRTVRRSVSVRISIQNPPRFRVQSSQFRVRVHSSEFSLQAAASNNDRSLRGSEFRVHSSEFSLQAADSNNDRSLRGSEFSLQAADSNNDTALSEVQSSAFRLLIRITTLLSSFPIIQLR